MTIAKPKIASIAPWFGAARMVAKHVGEALRGCKWVGIPFLGSGPELLHIDARTIVANDLHRHVINLWRCISRSDCRYHFIRELNRTLFHPDELKEAQDICRAVQPNGEPNLLLAAAYFTCCWMGRSEQAGSDNEYNGGPSTRWNATGGDSVVRFRNAVRSIRDWGKVIENRVTFVCEDAFDFLAKCKDDPTHGIYCDPPFPDLGKSYKHKFSEADHRRLANKLHEFKATRVVCRFYDHPLIRELYSDWTWIRPEGRKQTNEKIQEVLAVNHQ